MRSRSALLVLPARKLRLGEAEHLAVLAGADPAALLGVLVHGEALHLLEGPRPLAGRRLLQAHFLRVQREHGKLGRSEAAWNECTSPIGLIRQIHGSRGFQINIDYFHVLIYNW